RPAEVAGDSAAALPGRAAVVPIRASDPDGDPLTLRVVDQPAHGAAGLAGSAATYLPDPGFEGADSFTVAAWDGKTDSNLARISVLVSDAAPPPDLPDLALTCTKLVVKPAPSAKGRAQLKPCFRVENVGAAGAPAGRLRVLLSADAVADAGDAELGILKVAALAAGKHREVKAKLKAGKGVSTSGMFLLAVVNPDAAFEEAFRGDNTCVVGPLE
ncbi:MAG: hypothetical protein HUU06_08680, partial [Planctomycetaceae bacterium]|nr:hypothetical protein [Planctomycetaceae bacterium]